MLKKLALVILLLSLPLRLGGCAKSYRIVQGPLETINQPCPEPSSTSASEPMDLRWLDSEGIEDLRYMVGK